MKVLQVNRRWRSSSDSESYMFGLSQLLTDHGHEVIPFAVQDPGNEPSPYSSLFVSPLELTQTYRQPIHKIFGTAARIMYSRESRNRMSILADLTHPHVAHIHNIYLHISPSVLPPLVRRGVGIVMTVHDTKLFCPAHTSFRDDRECRRCRPYRYLACAGGRCVKGSSLASSFCAVELLAHDALHAYTGKVDRFIAPSWYMAGRLLDRGLPQEKVAVIPNFVDTGQWPLSDEEDEGYVFFGAAQLPEEGMVTLVRAFAEMPEIPLKVAGCGMMDQSARELAWDLGADNIEFLGYMSDREMAELMAGCRFLCVPYERPGNVPSIVLKAFSTGKPVVAAGTGAIPEAVREGITGRLMAPGDIGSTKSVVRELWAEPALCREMGRKARRLVEAEYSPQLHYDSIIKLYESVKRV